MSFNFSSYDAEQAIKVIDKVNETAEKRIEELAKSHNIVINSIELNKVSLESAPKDDEIGPIFSKLTETSREIGELENELEHLLTIEAQEKSLINFIIPKWCVVLVLVITLLNFNYSFSFFIKKITIM